MELADKDMKKLMNEKIYFNLEEVKIILYKLLCCIKNLHSAKIIHRDLKTANILL
jgi:mitogen-activated protein kinase 1/3